MRKKVPRALTPDLRALHSWYERRRRILPWREDPSPYRVWISEIMLQQTQVITALPFFERFMERFPTVKKLAHSSVEDVLAAWSGLGYYSRARNLHRASQEIVRNGFPESRQGWLDLPGVGEYTAGAVLSIAYNQVEALVDGNVERVFSRFLCLKRGSDYREQLWAMAREWVTLGSKKKINPRDLNQAWMELGATVCVPRNPKCGVCPLKKGCAAFKADRVGEFPQKKPRKNWIDVEETVFLIYDREERLLLRQRGLGEWRSGLWDFPLKGDLTGMKTVGLKAQSDPPIEVRYVVTRHRVKRKAVPLEFEALTPKERRSTIQSVAHSPSWIWWSERERPLGSIGVGSAFRKTLRAHRERD